MFDFCVCLLRAKKNRAGVRWGDFGQTKARVLNQTCEPETKLNCLLCRDLWPMKLNFRISYIQF